MLSNSTMEIAGLTHCFYDPKFIDFLSVDSFSDFYRKLLFRSMTIIRNNEHKSLDRFSELKLTNFANNERGILEKYIDKDDRYKLTQLPDYIVTFCRTMPEYNPLEGDYICNKLREYEFTRKIRNDLLDAAKKLEVDDNIENVLSDLTSINTTLFSKVNNFWEAMSEAEKDKTEFIAFGDLQLTNMFKPRNLCTVFADTGCLKTGFTIYMSLMFLKANPGKRVMYFEKEMPTEDIVDRLVCYFTDRTNTQLYNNKEIVYGTLRGYSYIELENQPREVQEMIDMLNRFIIVGPDEFKNADDMIKLIRYHEPDMWVLDFLTQLSQGETKGNADFNMMVMETCNKLKSVTQYGHPCLGVIVAQIKKGTVELRSNKVPLLDDIEWSGTLKQVCSHAIALFKPDVYYEDSVPSDYFVGVVKKNRYGVRNSALAYRVDAAKNQFREHGCEDIRRWFSEYRSRDLRR